MDKHAVDTPENETPNARAAAWCDLGLLALLLLLAVGVRGWLLTHTEVPARDTIGFIRYALEFESDSWRTVLRNNHQHPGYPLTILAVSVPVRHAIADPDMPPSEAMSLSAQLASNIAAVLLVIPMFFLGKLLFHRPAGVGAAALFQCLPVSGHILSDGLSEALFLLLASTALAFAVRATATRRPAHFAWCGLFCGLAYLTRPEGVLLLVATTTVLVLLPWLTGQSLPLRRALQCGICLVGVALLAGSPYFLATGRFTNKPSTHLILGKDMPTLDQQSLLPTGALPRAGARPPLIASAFAFVLRMEEPAYRRAYKAVWGLGGELVKCFHYAAWLPVVLGMWWYRRRMRIVPGMWVVLAACALQAAAVTFLAVKVGYLSDRHLLLLVLCGCCTAAAAAWELPGRLAAWLRRQKWSGAAGGPVALLLLPGMVAAGMPKTLDTLHGNRAGYHAAGLWLYQHAQPYDDIDDDHCWAHYYSGRVFQERKLPVAPPDCKPARYVVLGRREREIILTTNRKDQPDEDLLRAEGAVIVFHWPATSTPADAGVVVYRRP